MTNTKTMKNTNTKTKTKTQEIRYTGSDDIYHVKTKKKKKTECLKDPTYAKLLYFRRAEGSRISNITF